MALLGSGWPRINNLHPLMPRNASLANWYILSWAMPRQIRQSNCQRVWLSRTREAKPPPDPKQNGQSMTQSSTIIHWSQGDTSDWDRFDAFQNNSLSLWSDCLSTCINDPKNWWIFVSRSLGPVTGWRRGLRLQLTTGRHTWTTP